MTVWSVTLVARQKQTTIRISEELDALLDSEAKRLGMSKAAYIREALAARVAWTAARGRHEDVIEVLRRVWPDAPTF